MYWINPAGTLFVGIFFPIAGFLTLTLRFWGRVHKTRRGIKLGVDDWLILPAYTFMTGCSAIFIAGYATNTIGGHNVTNTTEELLLNDDPRQMLLERFEFAFNVLIVLALGFTKLSILFFYRRIFFGNKFNIASWIVISITIAWMITFLIIVIAGCGTHITAFWGPLVEINIYCPGMFATFFGQSIVDVVVDFMILVLPLPWILRLQMPWNRKLGVAAIFAVGTLSIACGITRLYLNILINSPALLFTLPPDDIAIVSDLMFCGMVETGVAVVASCLPTIIPALKAIRDAKAMQSLHGSINRILSLSSGSYSASSSRNKSRRQYRNESTDTMNRDDSSINDVGKGCQLKPISNSEMGDTPEEQHSFQVRNEYTIGHGV